MNVEFANVASSNAFSKAIDNSSDAKNWLIAKMSGYQTENTHCKYVIEIMLDPWGTDKERDFCWGIHWYEVNDYGEKVGDFNPIVNGGLIYRGLDDNGKWKYSSHT